MATSPGTEKGDNEINDKDNDGGTLEANLINETFAGDFAVGDVALKKDIRFPLDGLLLSKSNEKDICETKTLSTDLNGAVINDSEMKDEYQNDSVVYSESVTPDCQSNQHEIDHESENQSFHTSRREVEQMEIRSSEGRLSEYVHDEDVTTNEQSEKDEVMSVDRDELLTPEIDNPVKFCSDGQLGTTAAVINHAGSPGAKRLTADDDDSPKPKRQTPDREETLNNWKDDAGTDADQSSKDLPNPSSNSDDDDDLIPTSAAHRRLLRRRHQRQRRFGRQRLSFEDSDTTDDEDTNDAVKNTDEEEEKESDEEVRKAVLDILNKPTPKPNWYAVPELRKREYGYMSRQNVDSFREHVQGSLQMVKRLVLQESMKGHEGCVNALSFNRIGTLLASGSDDLNIVLWNWQRARPSLIYDSGHRSNVFQAKFMPFSGDCHVISCARDGQVRLAELSLTGVCKNTRKLAQHRGAAHKLALELDSPNVFLSCGEDAVTYLFDLREERPHKLVTTKENEKKVPLYSIHSNPCDSRQFCVGGRDHYIRVYDKRKIAEAIDGGVMKKFCPDHLVNSEVKANVTCTCYNYNGTEILGSYNDEDIYLFDNTMSDGANYVHKYTGHRNNATVKGVNFYGPKSEFIVSGSDCGHIYFWDKETEAIVNFQEGDDAGVINVLEPHPTLPVLATSGLDHDVKLWMPSSEMPEIDMEVLKKTLRRNYKERSQERVSAEPEMIGGQMLWFIMHHFRNSARRRMREEGQVLSSSDDNNDTNSEDSDTNEMQCAQS